MKALIKTEKLEIGNWGHDYWHPVDARIESPRNGESLDEFQSRMLALETPHNAAQPNGYAYPLSPRVRVEFVYE